MATARKRRKAIRTAAKLSINRPGEMTARGRRDIAAWLRSQAAHLLKHGEDYTRGQFRAGFHYAG